MVDAWLTAEGDDHDAGMTRFMQAMFVPSDAEDDECKSSLCKDTPPSRFSEDDVRDGMRHASSQSS